MPDSQIVAMGGGGFSMEPDNPLLDQFVLECAGGDRPRVCFLPTASGDADSYTVKFYAAMSQLQCEPCHLNLFSRTERDLREFVLGCDAVYVGGGNTANLLAVWRAQGLDDVLREAHGEGVVLSGISAGMNCWFEASIVDSFVDYGPLRDGVGILAGSSSPHYDGEDERQLAYRAAVEDGFPAGLALQDSCAAHFVDGELRELVCSVPGKQGFRVQLEAGVAVELPIEARHLGV